MKVFQSLFSILILSLLSSPSWSETIDELVERDGKYYLKFTDSPFTGKISGRLNGKIKNGERTGTWTYYHSNGQLNWKHFYKNGKLGGSTTSYHNNGNVLSKGNYEGGKKNGLLEVSVSGVFHFNDLFI